MPIPGFPDYGLDANGDIWSTRKGYWNRRTKSFTYRARMKKLVWRNTGYARKPYLGVGLSNGTGKQIIVKKHQIMALVHHGPRPSLKHYACHKDDNQLNNEPDNLYWGTAKENAADASRNRVAQCVADKVKAEAAK